MNFNSFVSVIKTPAKSKKIQEKKVEDTTYLLKKIFQYCNNCKKETVQDIVTDTNIICKTCNKQNKSE